MVFNDVDGFLRVSRLPLPGRHPLPCFLARFDRLAFEPALFDRCGIARPASIGASVPKRQAEFLAGRLCARAALRHHGKADTDVGIGSQRAPQWPPGVVGSITHNATWPMRLALGEQADLLLEGQRVVPARLPGEGFVFRHPGLAGALGAIRR